MGERQGRDAGSGVDLTEMAPLDLADVGPLDPFHLDSGALAPLAARYVAEGSLPSDVVDALPARYRGEILGVVHEPVLRFAVTGRHGGVVETIGVWVGYRFCVLAHASARSPEAVGTTPAGEPEEEHGGARSGHDRIIPIATEHLLHHLAVLLDLGPRPSAHGVDGALQLPAATLARILAGDGDELLPPQLPRGWALTLRSWAEDPPRAMTLTVGQPEMADGLEAVRWRSMTVIDDPDSGLWLCDDEVPVPDDRIAVHVAPTNPTSVLDLLASALRPRSDPSTPTPP